ncbi:hypothetical protein D2E23_1703 [Bifidobacterium callimiconis]|uniref:Uncharacterized protein n=1 Tax=Bifidobacterium callimiconis TaxID=2306973 RepID=A0A430FC24_9BIFI|nr:hypothetical protein D2E23_1703 [Bifidobacterium callimiconis]
MARVILAAILSITLPSAPIINSETNYAMAEQTTAAETRHPTHCPPLLIVLKKCPRQ